MGFEQALGSLPTRKQQLDMIHKLQHNWLSQPFYKFYMNQDIRRNKLDFADRLNKARSQFFFNFALYGLILMPFTIMAKRLFITKNGLPYILKPQYFNKQRTPFYAKNYYWSMWAGSSWLALTTYLAYTSTDYEGKIGDQFYKYGAKPVKML